MLVSRMIIYELFCVIANIQLCNLRFEERVELIQYWSLKLISFIYSKLCEALIWPITLTGFSNTPKQQISKDVFYKSVEWLPHYSYGKYNCLAEIQDTSLQQKLCFLRVLYLISKMLRNVNYFVAHNGKILICMQSFYKADIIFLCKCRIPHNLSSIDFLYSSFIQFFFTKV